MPYTAHGHFHGRWTPGDENIPITGERCGGLTECDECKAEAKAARKATLFAPNIIKGPKGA